MEQLNILLIDRSPVFCQEMKQFLEANKPVNEVKITTDLTEGLQILTEFSIHIVILDVAYPNDNEQSALRVILNHKVLPVIVVAEPSIDQTAKTVTAMSNGAIDFIKKINFKDRELLAKFEAELVLKMQSVKQADRLHSIARKVKENPLKENPDVHKQSVQIVEPPSILNNRNTESIIVIGASTGGPRALHQVFQQLPRGFDEPILIVQHMPEKFTKSLAERLNNIGNIPVKEAVHREKIKKGTAYIAPGNYHMQVKKVQNGLEIELSQGHEHLSHRPSVDLLFESVAVLYDRNKIAVVLTGMGRDGTYGVGEIKKQDQEAIILVESKETAVIDGMPRSVIEMNLATQVLQIQEMGSAISEYTRKRGK